MFLELDLKRDILIPPQLLQANGGHRRAAVVKLLNELQELQCSEEHGYYIAPRLLKQIHPGSILSSKGGSVLFTIEFTCITFKLFKNQVVDVEVSKVVKGGYEASCGPCDSILVHRRFIPSSFNYSSGCFQDEASAKVIKVGSVVRVKLLEVQFEEQHRRIQALATMSEPFLGIQDDV